MWLAGSKIDEQRLTQSRTFVVVSAGLFFGKQRSLGAGSRIEKTERIGRSRASAEEQRLTMERRRSGVMPAERHSECIGCAELDWASEPSSFEHVQHPAVVKLLDSKAVEDVASTAADNNNVAAAVELDECGRMAVPPPKVRTSRNVNVPLPGVDIEAIDAR